MYIRLTADQISISDLGSAGLREIPPPPLPPFYTPFCLQHSSFCSDWDYGKIGPNGERGSPLVTVTPLLLFLYSDPGMLWERRGGESWVLGSRRGAETVYVYTDMHNR